jgi:flagellar biosynthesis/type III secretory pathway protein FliH
VTLARARIWRGAARDAQALPTPPPATGVARGRVVPAAVVAAQDKARAIIAQAEQRAEQIVRTSEREAARVRLRAETEGRADGAAAIAAQALALAAHEARADERQLERSIELAILLAERLLGEALQLDPERVVALARQALREIRSTRQITIVAHPDDARVLERSLSSLPAVADTARVQPDPSRERGNLRLEMESGVLDARLSPQLERLALKLRESLRP